MARTKTETDLRATPGGVFIVSVKLHEQVDILETKDDSVRVRLPKVFGAPVGFSRRMSRTRTLQSRQST